MPETISHQKQIEILKKEKADLQQQLDDAKSFFAELTIIKLPLTIKGHAAVILECMVSNDIAEKIKKLIDENTSDKPAEQSAEKSTEQYETSRSPLPSDQNQSQFPNLIIDELKNE